MRIGASLFLIAVGAILKFAVTDKVNNVDLGTVGIVLMVVGVLGLLFEAIYAASRHRRDVVVHDATYPAPPAGRAGY